MVDLTRFLACWPDVLAQECPFPNDWTNPKNFSNDPHDPGGKTMDGIIQTEYTAYCTKHDLPQMNVRNITQAQGQDIYVSNFWLPHCPDLSVGLDLEFFDANVNEGSKEAIRILQVALGINNDGIWGPQTEAAIAAITNINNVIVQFTHRRKIVYTETSGFQYFGTDWIRRATEIGNQALDMAAGTAQSRKLTPLGVARHVPRAVWFLPK